MFRAVCRTHLQNNIILIIDGFMKKRKNVTAKSLAAGQFEAIICM